MAVRSPVLGAVVGAGAYLFAVFVHGGVREKRGCVLDSPVYEIVNGPVLVAAKLGLPVRPEGVGEAPPLGWVPPPRPPFSATLVVASGLVAFAALGAAVSLAISRARRR